MNMVTYEWRGVLEKSPNSQFHIYQVYLELKSSDNMQVWEEKLFPTS